MSANAKCQQGATIIHGDVVINLEVKIDKDFNPTPAILGFLTPLLVAVTGDIIRRKAKEKTETETGNENPSTQSGEEPIPDPFANVYASQQEEPKTEEPAKEEPVKEEPVEEKVTEQRTPESRMKRR